MSARIRAVLLFVLFAGLISCSDNDSDGDAGESSGSVNAETSEIRPVPADTERFDESGNIQSDALNADRTDNDDRTGEADDVRVDVGVTAELPATDAANTTDEVPDTVGAVRDPGSAHVGIIVVADAGIGAEFFAYPTTSESADVPMNLSALASHVCHSSDSAEIASMQIESAVTLQSVDAGEVIVMTDQHGTFIELERLMEAGRIRYATRINLDEIGNPPNRLVVDIPGHDFPSFLQIEVPSRLSGDSDEIEPNAAPDSYANASSTAVSNNETNPDGQETMDSDASGSVSVRQVSCSTIPSVDSAEIVDRIESVIVKMVQRGKDLLLLFRLVT